MIGIVFATHREAAPFLMDSAATRLADEPMALFRPGEGAAINAIVAISGMGKVAAAMAAMHLVLKWRVKVLINAGLCGWLGGALAWKVGDILRIRQAVEGDCDRFGDGEAAVACDPEWFPELETARLVTCDRPVFDSAWREKLAARGELADMEGAAVARVAARYGIPCAMLKGISDTADEHGRRDVGRHMEQIAATLAKTLMRALRPLGLNHAHTR